MPSKQIRRIGRGAQEGALATLLALTAEAVFVFDGSGEVLFANEEAAVMLNRTSDELVGTSVRDLFVTTSYERVEEGAWPFPLDGSTATLSLRIAAGLVLPVSVRADRVTGPGETYLAVVRSLDDEREAARERDRLVDELSEANHRLSGTLRIVLDTLDSQDMGVLFSRVLEELRDTMSATGTLVYLSESDGFRLRGTTASMEGARVSPFLPYGKGIATLAARSGHALRLRILPPGTGDLRSGSSSREVLDEETRATHKVPSRYLPPFASFLAVPVWFGDQVIAIIEVGWDLVHPMRRDDARLLDAVAQYLSVQLMAAFTAMRSERAAELDRLVGSIRDDLTSAGHLDSQIAEKLVERVGEILDATPVVLGVNPWQKEVLATLPKSGDVEITVDLATLEHDYLEDGVAVVPVRPAGPLGSWLVEHHEASTGALVDMGEVAGARRCLLLLRPDGSEPFEDVELSFLHRLCDVVRDVVAGGEARSQDTRISQALQQGMRNELQKVDGIEAAGLYSSATAAAFVGGDFYDLVRLPDMKACVVLGDVSGKGIEAASVSAAVKTALEAYAWEELPPAHMVRSLNEFLMGFSRLETFATMFVGMIDLRHSTLTYCSAGHPPAFLLRARRGELETLDVQSGVVGAFHEMNYRDGTVRLHRGDVLYLYTDGVTEARDENGAFFGEDGLRDMLMRESCDGFDGMLDRMLEDIDVFTGRHLDDDVAMVSLRFDVVGDGPKPRRRPEGEGAKVKHATTRVTRRTGKDES